MRSRFAMPALMLTAASEAAMCANAQGRFWEYHDKLYAGPADASAPALNAVAQALGLDMTAFEACRISRQFQARVQADVDEGQRLGVTGTPAFFINGRVFSGAHPIENFVAIIEEELKTAR